MAKEMYSAIWTTSPGSILTIYVLPTMKLQGLIMKGRPRQSLNSDFPVVSSLSSITSTFFMNSRPLVTSDQQGGKKDEVMEKNEKKYLKKSRAMHHVLESQLDTE